jgi:hypothetical protein
MSTLPGATLVEVPPAGQIVQTAPANVAVFLGCSSKGTLSQPLPFGAQQTAACELTYGAGPLSRQSCYPMAKVPVQFVCIRLPAVSVAATISTPALVQGGSSTWTSTLSGTPTDGLDVVINFIVGGTTGSSGITYQVSTDGGNSFGSTQNLASATSITVGGVSIALGSGHVVTAGDSAAWWTTPASATILPTTVTRASGSSTSTYVFSGTPNDGYEMAIQIVTGGTVGAAGITFMYSLDYWAGANATWSLVTALPLSGVYVIPDHNDSTGITITVGAGVVVAGDLVTANTTPPMPQWSDASAALDTLRNSNLTWSFVVFTGYATRAFRDSLETKLQSYATSGRFTWGTVQARDRITGETTTSPDNTSGDLAWSGRLLAEWGTSVGDRTPPQAGSARVRDPQTGRYNRVPRTAIVISRIVGTSPDTDPGDRTLPNDGAYSSDVSITTPAGQLCEHDARVNPSLFNLGFNVLRTWYGESGLAPGVFDASGRLMAASGDIQRWQYRRVQDLADAACFAAMAKLISSKFGVWPSTVRPPYVAGDIMVWDLNNLYQLLFAAVFAAVGNYVSAPRSGGIQVVINPTPGIVNGSTVVYQSTKLTGKQYLDQFSGTLGWVNPTLAALFTGPSASS